MAASRVANRDQRCVEDLGLVVWDLGGCFAHADLPGGIPTHAPMMPQQPVELSPCVYKATRT